MRSLFASKFTCLALVISIGLGAMAWWQRGTLLAWHHVRQLAHADLESRDACARQVANLHEAALPSLLNRLSDCDHTVCGNMRIALMLMMTERGASDPRSCTVAEALCGRFVEFSPAGQEAVVQLLAAVLQNGKPKPLSPRLTKPVSEILVAAEKASDTRASALQLAGELVESVQPGQWADVCRDMALRGMKDEHAATRSAAVRLLLREPMSKNRDLQETALPLLRDPEAAVRRAAVLSLASENEVVREEHLLPLLHDDDVDVQYVCELALRKRGLQDDDITMARLISHAEACTRMRVLHYLGRRPNINLDSWLQRLSNDPEPAVRAAALRAAGDFPQVDFLPRLREMAERDPSPSVRLNARYFLAIRSQRLARD